MTELKTMKDLEAFHCNGCEGCGNDGINKNHLKQEAIKWIRYTQEHIKPTSDPIFIHKNLAIISWIKYFLNITEEDLK